MASSDRSETSRTGSHTQPQHKPFANTTFRANIVYSNTPPMSTTIKTTTEMYHVMFSLPIMDSVCFTTWHSKTYFNHSKKKKRYLNVQANYMKKYNSEKELSKNETISAFRTKFFCFLVSKVKQNKHIHLIYSPWGSVVVL